MLVEIFKCSEKNGADLTLSDNGIRGLAMIMDHCADMTVNAIGILPSKEGLATESGGRTARAIERMVKVGIKQGLQSFYP